VVAIETRDGSLCAREWAAEKDVGLFTLLELHGGGYAADLWFVPEGKIARKLM
jgi:hypothetical protein